MQGLEEEGGPDDGFALGGDVGAMVSACVRAVRVSGRLKEGRGAGKRGPWDNDTAHKCAMHQGADKVAPLRREGGSACERARRDADRWGPPISGRGRARGGLSWAGLGRKAGEGGRLGSFPFFFYS